MSKKIVLLIVMVMCLFALTGCLDSKNDKPTTASGEKKIIHMGVAGPFLQYVEIIKRDFEAKGYELKITYFDDSIQPNTALAEGTIDANFYQHVPFLKSYNEKNSKMYFYKQSPKLAKQSTYIQACQIIIICTIQNCA